jgi:hypothetical protein
MNISWVLADSAVIDPTQDIDALKRLGAFWGSWRTWRAFQTDNVICHDMAKAAELTKRNFQSRCNFYIPNSVHTSLDRPANVRLYAGEFVHDVVRQEEIVAIHLAATTSDIVLLLGWDLGELVADADRLKTVQAQHHRNLLCRAIRDYDQVQWVLVDHPTPIMKDLANLENLSTDIMENVLALATD